jgi:tetratricopeptide (TPR) repeat protein
LFRLGPGHPTLATILRSAGYRTGAFVGAFVLDARFGLNTGFDVYDDRYGDNRSAGAAEGAERRAEDVIKPALDWILNSNQPPAPGTQNPPTQNAPRTLNPPPRTQEKWFAWIHLYDPHEPYRAPEPYASQHPPYDAEVAYVDAQVGRLLDTLRSAGALENTLVSVVADHGESLGEHGERTHGVFVYEVTIRVPWMVWAGARVSGESGTTARLIDVAPTLLDLIGVTPPRDFEGASIVPRVKAGGDGPAVYVEAMDANITRNWAPLTGIVSGRTKFINLPIPELYDLNADPGEASNVYTREPERARTLESLLRNSVSAYDANSSSAETVRLSGESRQRLQALGYVASTADASRRTYTDADDPKRLIEPAEELNRALAAFRNGSRNAALASVETIIKRYPAFSTAYGVLASMRHDLGDLGGAISTLESVVRQGVADQSVMVVLAGYLQEAGALQQSAALLEAVIASHPDYADAYNSLGVACSRMGRHDRAHAAFRKVIELDPTSATAYENLGVDANAQGNLAAAADYLRRALELDDSLARAHNALAAVLLRQGKRDDAVGEWRKALNLDPHLLDAMYNLGTVLAGDGRNEEARPFLERFAAEAPPARYGADISRVREMIERLR